MVEALAIHDLLMDLLIDKPYFGYLAARCQFRPNPDIPSTKMVFHDGPLIQYNSEWMASLNYDHQKGAIIHELLHLAFLHFYRREQRDPGLWHMACDIATSEFMAPEQRHQDILTGQMIFINTSLRLPVKKDAETYYEALSKIDDDIDLTYDSGKAEVVFNNGEHFTKDLLEDLPQDDLEAMAMVKELATLQSSAYGEGVIPDQLGAHTEAIYKPYKINWRNTLKKFMTGQGRIITRKSYKRQSRRYDQLPGTKRFAGVKVLVAIDESASVSNKDVAAFHKELVRINRITGTDIKAVRFDSTCSSPVSLHQFIAENKRQRRGGTDFRPVFEVADQLKMPLVILFTDGEGQAPTSVNQKVLWVLTNNGHKPSTYGMEVMFSEE